MLRLYRPTGPRSGPGLLMHRTQKTNGEGPRDMNIYLFRLEKHFCQRKGAVLKYRMPNSRIPAFHACPLSFDTPLSVLFRCPPITLVLTDTEREREGEMSIKGYSNLFKFD